ncbi:uncharacterized protein LOC121409123 [Lytechinus variegatus]|uniref:uncharacterized protein LOC121409123 n=1 Tax=Lytechinus variegatus TaxID=7654 RepID=UPI001BB1DE85|nr:uncharacterized protein LOC121409123 [Lytechinus variegatus]
MPAIQDPSPTTRPTLLRLHSISLPVNENLSWILKDFRKLLATMMKQHLTLLASLKKGRGSIHVTCTTVLLVAIVKKHRVGDSSRFLLISHLLLKTHQQVDRQDLASITHQRPTLEYLDRQRREATLVGSLLGSRSVSRNTRHPLVNSRQYPPEFRRRSPSARSKSKGKFVASAYYQPIRLGKKFLQSNPGPMPARQSASDELEYLTFWPTNDSSQLEDPSYSDEGASSDDCSQSAPVFLGVRTRRAESCEEGLLNSPLKPRQLQRLSDMEPTEEIARTRFHQVTAARRSQSCSSEPGADQAKRPCSPLVLPEVDSGTNVQILPNNVQVFTPPPAKSTTPPTSRHGHMTSSTKAYLSD